MAGQVHPVDQPNRCTFWASPAAGNRPVHGTRFFSSKLTDTRSGHLSGTPRAASLKGGTGLAPTRKRVRSMQVPVEERGGLLDRALPPRVHRMTLALVGD